MGLRDTVQDCFASMAIAKMSVIRHAFKGNRPNGMHKLQSAAPNFHFAAKMLILNGY